MTSWVTILGFIFSLILLLAWLYLALLHARFWQPLVHEPSPQTDRWPDIDIVTPARNEAEALPGSLPSLLSQDYAGYWRIILVDDHSSDGTTELAQRLAALKGATEKLTCIAAPELAKGWVGKVAAMQKGASEGTAEYILFTDADIYHAPFNLRRLVARAEINKFDLTSLMVRLHCASFAEKLLIPAFVFFFAMLYPFRLASDPNSRIAAAAGGVMLVRREALEKAGGLTAIKGALIDDCALAKLIKDSGGRIDLALTNDASSIRQYPLIGDIWRMIARTAFTQLGYSTWNLIGTVFLMLSLFIGPLALAAFGDPLAARIASIAFFVSLAIFVPLIRFYRLPTFWVTMLPAAAILYLLATCDSARLYWRGEGGGWKDRSQA